MTIISNERCHLSAGTVVFLCLLAAGCSQGVPLGLEFKNEYAGCSFVQFDEIFLARKVGWGFFSDCEGTKSTHDLNRMVQNHQNLGEGCSVNSMFGYLFACHARSWSTNFSSVFFSPGLPAL